MYVYFVIKSLCTNIYSSLIQIGACPCKVCIAWRVVGDHSQVYTNMSWNVAATSNLYKCEQERGGHFKCVHHIAFHFVAETNEPFLLDTEAPLTKLHISYETFVYIFVNMALLRKFELTHCVSVIRVSDIHFPAYKEPKIRGYLLKTFPHNEFANRKRVQSLYFKSFYNYLL
jgi:hypothetical protein